MSLSITKPLVFSGSVDKKKKLLNFFFYHKNNSLIQKFNFDFLIFKCLKEKKVSQYVHSTQLQ